MFKNFEIKKVSEPFHILKTSEQNKINIFLFSNKVVSNLFILMFFVKESIGEMLSLSILFKNYMSPIL